MHLLGTAAVEWISAVAPAVTAVATSILAAVALAELLSDRRSGPTGSDERLPTSTRPPDVPVHRQPSHARRLRAPTRLAPAAPRTTPEEEADLIARGLPERLVRSGTLDYASLTSGSFADRLRNGCV